MMRPSLPILVMLLLLAVAAPLGAVQNVETAPPAAPRVVLVTSLGEIALELFPDKAPKTVANFLQYAGEGHYNGTLFHRVIDNLLIQGGRYTPDLNPKPVRDAIPNEADNGLSNLRGTIAAARVPSDPDSATSEFFINVVDNPRFDFSDAGSPFTRGYTVFGRVVAGMDVVDRIRAVPTTERAPLPRDVPVEPVVIEQVRVLESLPQRSAQ